MVALKGAFPKKLQKTLCSQSEKSGVMLDRSKYFYEFVKLRET